MTSLQLYTNDDFFYNSRLVGINTQLEDYTISSILNKTLNLEFVRATENSIISHFHPKPKLTGSLFEQLEVDTPNTIAIEFPLFKHTPHFSSTHMYLYNNRVNGYYLLDDYKNGELLLLIKNPELLLFEWDILELLRRIKGINSAIELHLSKLKFKQNLLL